jgi:hypothetical protein
MKIDLDGVSQWLDTAQAVPMKDMIEEEHAIQAQELKYAIISLKANTRSSAVSLESICNDTIIPDIAASSTKQKRELSSGTLWSAQHIKKAKTVSPNGKDFTKTL